MEDELLRDLEKLVKEDGRFKKEAYYFLYEALQYTVDKMDKTHLPDDERHISGKELLYGISEYAMDQFGPLTLAVLHHWGVHQTRNFGEIVFNLVDANLMSKTENDCIDDFDNVYDFADEFNWKKRKNKFRRLAQ
tara:strand:+ start:1910 stop:2314 length:405 start_codon:yes stop_codon:yes gene_type:complete